MSSEVKIIDVPLGQLEEGVLTLRAPVEDDAIQLGKPLLGPERPKFAKLTLTLGEGVIEVARQDEEPLQFELYGDSPREERLVLAAPLTKLVLRKTCEPPQEVWIAEDSQGAPLQEAVDGGISVVACAIYVFAGSKQEELKKKTPAR